MAEKAVRERTTSAMVPLVLQILATEAEVLLVRLLLMVALVVLES
jgi:hypothetical protein